MAFTAAKHAHGLRAPTTSCSCDCTWPRCGAAAAAWGCSSGSIKWKQWKPMRSGMHTPCSRTASLGGRKRQHRIRVTTAQATPFASSTVSPPFVTDGAQAQGSAVTRLYDALNTRDEAALLTCFAEGAEYTNLAFADVLTGAAAVCRFYQQSLRSLPEGAEIYLEQHCTAPNSQHDLTDSTAVVWRLMLPSQGTTISRGIALFTLDASGRISRVLDSPEHPVKLSTRGLSVFGPLAQRLATPMLPAVQEINRVLQQGMDMLLQPLEDLAAQQANSSVTVPRGTSSSGSSGGSSPQLQSAPMPATSWMLTDAQGSLGAANAAVPSPPAPTAAAIRAQPRSAAAGIVAPAAVNPPAGRTTASDQQPRTAVAAAAAAGFGPPNHAEDTQQIPVNFSGLWVKVPERSDTVGYEAALDVLGLSSLQKVTARLIEGVDIQHTPSMFIVNFVTVVPFFRVTEAVPLDGGSSQLSRRDLRFGMQRTAATSVEGGVLVDMSWGPPMAGTLTEKYTLLQDGYMCVEAVTCVGDKSATSKIVYKRSGGSRDELLSDSQKRNPSVAAVMQRQRQQGLDV